MSEDDDSQEALSKTKEFDEEISKDTEKTTVEGPSMSDIDQGEPAPGDGGNSDGE